MKHIFDFHNLNLEHHLSKNLNVMTMITNLKHSFLFLISVLISTFSVAQTTTDNSLTVDEVINEFLLGGGVNAFNVTYNGIPGDTIHPRVGTFNSEGTGFPFEDGMIMATKNIQIATCGMESDGSGTGQESDLSQIVGGQLNDVTVVEFDFIPAGDTVRFNFVFASREYHQWVCSNFNDVFGFFISGPGIDGPYSDGGENIALLPDGVTPVAINSVNNGSPNGIPCTVQGTGDICPCNSEYFINNGGGDGTSINSDVCYGGYTVSLEALAVVECGEVYHMKLALANVVDGNFDSGVFLEKGSFSSNVVVDVIVDPILDGIVIGDDEFNNGIVAGCTNAQFCLFRPDTIGVDTAYFELGGSAQAGVQYFLPDNDSLIVFPEGVDTVCIDIISIANDLGPQVDTLTISTFTVNACGDTIVNYATIEVYNEYSYDVNTTDISIECPTDFVEISGTASNGLSPYSYEWSLDGEIISNEQTTSVVPPTGGQTDIYTLSVTDGCGLHVEQTTLSVTDNTVPPPLADITPPADTISCTGQTVDLTAIGTGGQGDLEYLWSNNDTGSETTVTPDGNETVTYYYVTVTDECGQTGMDSIPVYFIPEPPEVAISTSPSDTVNCLGDEVELTANATSPAGIASYNWSTNESSESITVEPDGMETITYYYVTVTDECDASATDSVAIYFIPLDPPIAIPGEDTTVVCPGDTVELTATAIGGSGPYQYLWQPGGTSQSITVSPQGTTPYILTITDACGASSEPAEVTVNVPVYDPVTVELPSITSVCPGDLHILTPDVSGGAGIYDYEWSPDGQISSSITVSPSQLAQYVVQVTDQCGNRGQGNSIVSMPDYEDITFTPKATPSCTGESFTLSVADISGGAGETASDYFYAWVGPVGQFIDSTEVSSTGSITLSNAVPGIYTLFVMDVCNNSAIDTINADLLGIEFIPNVITPNNGDNVNDVFIVPGSHIYETRVTIMDRWGKVAFESDQYVCDRLVMDDPGTLIDQNCWRGGDDKGDVFYYMIDVDNGACGFQGTVHILDNN